MANFSNNAQDPFFYFTQRAVPFLAPLLQVKIFNTQTGQRCSFIYLMLRTELAFFWWWTNSTPSPAIHSSSRTGPALSATGACGIPASAAIPAFRNTLPFAVLPLGVTGLVLSASPLHCPHQPCRCSLSLLQVSQKKRKKPLL